MIEEKRIYCVVAETVQHPLTSFTLLNGKLRPAGIAGLKRLPSTRSIDQVPGRIAAQVGHAVSRMRHSVLRGEVHQIINEARKSKRKYTDEGFWFNKFRLPFQPLTTIVLGARDSFELEHVYGLLRDVAGVMAYKFNDTNPDVYGEGEVTTAFATVPVLPTEVIGILDYLPLWSPKP